MERGFVLKPLVDVAPSLVDPVSGMSVSDALLRVDTNGITEISHVAEENG
jgi:7,8-dihydro-6-hydroxymethylpterin-pyrophosphokinase